MISDSFESPQRQSKVGIVIMFAYSLQQYFRALLPIFVLSYFNYNKVPSVYIALSIIAILGIIAVISYLKYLNFTFYIDRKTQEFIVTEGILSKTMTTVPLGKIQQVNIVQTLLQRVIGVYALDVQTAGTNEKEISIKAIPKDLAQSLKEALLESRISEAINETEISTEAKSKNFIEISLGTLIKVGITSNYLRTLGVITAFIFTIYDNLVRFSEKRFFSEDDVKGLMHKTATINVIAIIVIVLLLAMIITNLIRTIVRFYNFSVRKDNGSLLIFHGLFDTKSTIIKPSKVQTLSLTQNYFQKKLDILQFKVKQASGGESEKNKNSIELPGFDKRESNEILRLIFDQIPSKGELIKPNYRKFGFAVFLTVAIPLSIVFFVLKNQPLQISDYYGYMIFYGIVGIILNAVSFMNYKLYAGEHFIEKVSGIWDIQTQIVEYEKIQSLKISQLFWHKSANIGYLDIVTAGSTISFQLGNFDRIKYYANLWLYKIEKDSPDWY